MIGQRLSHYRIIAKIGAGGMGEVYSAHDERLEREVALKIIRAGSLADEAARKRFRKEALALSKLNHPNIATIFDFDSDDEAGLELIAMEFVPGETLAERARRGPMPEKDAVTLAKQIAEALEEAHDRGIVHRDLKPGNVMVTPKGRAKVLDFGLARLLHPEVGTPAAVTWSETQGVSGTLPYMSPEQLRDEAVDARSDIFSLGALLYELTTGRLPFPETVASRLTDAILNREPVPPRALNPRISPELERIILKCLEKDPRLRYQAAKELWVDLHRLSAPTSASAVAVQPQKSRKKLWIGVTVAALALLALLLSRINLFVGVAAPNKIQSLAVLPLNNLSADPAQEYFADGMTEELTTELAQISGLKVISRTSTMRYKGSHAPLPQIARELGVDAVIEGSVERAGNEVRITAQLINAHTDAHLWARSYHRDLKDVLAMQSEVAQAIAGEVKVQLTPQEQARLQRSREVDPAAYEAYLQGVYHFNFHTGPELQKAIDEFQEAIRLDPTYALAYAGLANSYGLLPFNGDARPKDVMPQAKAAALKAVELDPELAEGHAALAVILHQYDWDWDGAEREFKAAIAKNPNDARARMYYSDALTFMGRHDEAIAEGTKGREFDPLSPLTTFILGMDYHLARRYDLAITEYQRALQVNERFWPAHVFLGEVYEQQGKYPQALAELEKGEGPTLEARAQIGHLYALSGRRAEAEKILQEFMLRSKDHYVPPRHFAKIYAGLGDKDEAFAWLDKAIADRESGLEFVKTDPSYDSLHSDPRFKNVLRRLNLAD